MSCYLFLLQWIKWLNLAVKSPAGPKYNFTPLMKINILIGVVPRHKKLNIYGVVPSHTKREQPLVDILEPNLGRGDKSYVIFTYISWSFLKSEL